MVLEHPQRPTDGWSTTEAADLSGFHAHTLWRLVEKGLVTPSIERGVGSGRFSWWSSADVELLGRIKARLDYGMTIEGALRTDDPPRLAAA